jgi:GTP-binding protein
VFLDEVSITVKAGNGGNGAISFFRNRHIAKGGPDGGHGGHGGNVILLADTNLNTLYHFRGVKLFRAQNGQSGAGQDMAGKGGKDLYIKVPTGTIVFENGQPVMDLYESGQMYLASRGGLGGKGNSNFASSTRQTPRFAELGEPGEERKLHLELKLVADVGIIGLPSVGKSTLISVVSAARPKIADYPFTTLQPNLGVVAHSGSTFVVTDLPGLIKGASRGKGLGHKFLRHAERVRFFWHLVPANSTTPVADYRIIREELRKFNPELANKTEIPVISKADLTDEKTLNKLSEKIAEASGRRPLVISGATHRGVNDLLNATIEHLQQLKSTEEPQNQSSELPIYQPHLDQKSKRFTIKKQNKKLYHVDGPRLNQIVVMSDLKNPEAVARVQDVLNKMGISRELHHFGAEPGAKLEIAGKSLEWWG